MNGMRMIIPCRKLYHYITVVPQSTQNRNLVSAVTARTSPWAVLKITKISINITLVSSMLRVFYRVDRTYNSARNDIFTDRRVASRNIRVIVCHYLPLIKR